MFSAWTYQKAGDWPDYDVRTIQSVGVSLCVAGKDYVHIEANGDVLPCMIHGADFRPKNVLKDGLDAALRHVKRHNCGDCRRVCYNEARPCPDFGQERFQTCCGADELLGFWDCPH